MSGLNHNTELHSRCRHHRWLVPGLYLLLLGASVGQADELSINVTGVRDPELSQIRNRVSSFAVTGSSRLTPRRLRQLVEDVERVAAESLRPYGYYHAEIHSTLTAESENSWRLDLNVVPGPPLIVVASTIEITGDGADLPQLKQWKKDWPLGVGQRLDQTVWETRKQAALDLAQAEGYLGAGFTEHRISAAIDRNEATTSLALDTGHQAVIGKISFDQDILKPGILELVPRFSEGQAYDAWLLEKFSLDLWRTGYFDDVEIVEERRLEEQPPRVNLLITTKARNRNTYQGSLGYGTDTEIRTQVQWNRHLLSSRGDSLNVGLGWQQQFNEYSFKTNYRLPRRVRAREFWTADLFVGRKNQDFKVKAENDDRDFIKLTNGNWIDYSVKLGRLIIRDRKRGYQQIFETWYGQYVLEKATFSLRDFAAGDQNASELGMNLEQFRDIDSSLALGVNWDWPVIHGSGFETTGHHERAWIFTANKAWGSTKTFTQAYLSSSWHRMLGQKWKLLLRGEVGYSDADVSKLQLDLPEGILKLSVTDLPNLYRFKAGGGRSVRGYGFENLSNNGIGSNNIVTSSAELEWSFRQNWSVAAFFDAGNAFNDWGAPRLKRGAGIGLRWYSIAGPVRVDIAQALDIEGHPWQLHFTIGTPLL
jgi:translocation and assembly module TamA